jgi:hypothetical protein
LFILQRDMRAPMENSSVGSFERVSSLKKSSPSADSLATGFLWLLGYSELGFARKQSIAASRPLRRWRLPVRIVPGTPFRCKPGHSKTCRFGIGDRDGPAQQHALRPHNASFFRVDFDVLSMCAEMSHGDSRCSRSRTR